LIVASSADVLLFTFEERVVVAEKNAKKRKMSCWMAQSREEGNWMQYWNSTLYHNEGSTLRKHAVK